MQSGWSKNGIKTYEELEQHFSKLERINGIKKEVANKLRILRPLNSFEEEYISKWTEEYGYGINIIEMALKRSVLKSSVGFKYYDELLTDWHIKGLKTPDDIEKHLSSITEKKIRNKEVQTIANKYEFTQSTFDSFENLYDN